MKEKVLKEKYDRQRRTRYPQMFKIVHPVTVLTFKTVYRVQTERIITMYHLFQTRKDLEVGFLSPPLPLSFYLNFHDIKSRDFHVESKFPIVRFYLTKYGDFVIFMSLFADTNLNKMR